MAKVEAERSEWSTAQEVVLSVDLVKAAKRQLQFLAAVDDVQCLHDGPGLDRAIYRYEYCWLPLLAKHTESPLIPEPLVVPLDCEWIWHCHRLNPYKIDCEEIYGRILDNLSVVSMIGGASTEQTERIWNGMYPTEPYRLEQSCSLLVRNVETQRSIQYDLVESVKRQSPFFKKVSISIMRDDHFLEESVARYRGFLHLMKRKEEGSVKGLCVPTCDIDLIWHSHQLYPVSYCNDLEATIGEIVDHNDRDFDSPMLRIGLVQTTRLWEDTYGRKYLRGGAMYEGADCAKCYSCGVISTA